MAHRNRRVYAHGALDWEFPFGAGVVLGEEALSLVGVVKEGEEALQQAFRLPPRVLDPVPLGFADRVSRGPNPSGRVSLGSLWAVPVPWPVALSAEATVA